MTTKSNSTFGPFDEHGRFVFSNSDLTADQRNEFVKGVLDHFNTQPKCPKCSSRMTFQSVPNTNNLDWACWSCGHIGEDAPKPELTSLAPSPWSPVAPTEPGFYWWWNGQQPANIKAFRVEFNGTDLCIWPSLIPVNDIGGFWTDRETEVASDRTAEILVQQLANLEEQARILRHGYFTETAAVIDGVVSTLRAAFEKEAR